MINYIMTIELLIPISIKFYENMSLLDEIIVLFSI